MFKTRFEKQVVTLPKLSVEENNVDLNPGNVTEEHMVVFGHRKASIRVTHMGKIRDGDARRAPPLPTDTRAYACAHAHTHTHTRTHTRSLCHARPGAPPSLGCAVCTADAVLSFIQNETREAAAFPACGRKGRGPYFASLGSSVGSLFNNEDLKPFRWLCLPYFINH